MNTVLAGAYQGKRIFISPTKGVCINLGKGKGVFLDKQNVFRYDLVEQDNEIELNVDYIGFFAEASSRQINTYRVIVYFRNGNKSFIEIDQKTYKALIVGLFGVEDYVPLPEAEPEEKKNHHIAARTCIWLITTVVCIIITQAIYPSVDGYKQIDMIGTLFLLMVPILATIFLPRIIFKNRKKK